MNAMADGIALIQPEAYQRRKPSRVERLGNVVTVVAHSIFAIIQIILEINVIDEFDRALSSPCLPISSYHEDKRNGCQREFLHFKSGKFVKSRNKDKTNSSQKYLPSRK
jgi:hypothetical protein